MLKICGHIQCIGQKLADFHAMPAFKPGGIQNPTTLAVQRAGRADADAKHLVPFYSCQHSLQFCYDRSHQIVLVGQLFALQQVSCHITQPHAASFSRQIHREGIIAICTQSKGCGTAASAHRLRRKLCHNSKIQQLLHNQGGCGTGQSCDTGQFCPTHGFMPQNAQNGLAVVFLCIVSVAWFLRHFQISLSFMRYFCASVYHHYTVSCFFCQFA